MSVRANQQVTSEMVSLLKSAIDTWILHLCSNIIAKCKNYTATSSRMESLNCQYQHMTTVVNSTS